MELKEEEVPVNNIGTGNIPGAGVGSQGEPIVKKRKLVGPVVKRYKGFKEFTHDRRAQQ